MIEGLNPYGEYKESGLPWLEQVPSHWRICRNGNLFTQRNQTGYAELPILEVSLKTGVRVRDFLNSSRKQIMSDLSKYKRAVKGDAAYNMMRMWQGAIGVSPVDGLVSPAYVVLRPNPGVDANFYSVLFRTGAYMSEIDNCSHGIVKDRNRLYWDQFKQMPSLLPPPDEQSAIVRFLDYANRKIDRFIRSKRKLIVLLGEQKQAIIHRAVTHGLNPNVPLKPSGIPWIGDILAKWSTTRLKNMCRIRGGFAFKTDSFRDDGIPIIRMSNLRRGILDLSEAVRIASSDCVSGFELKKGDVLYGLSGSIGATGSLGNYAVVSNGDLPAQLNQRVARFRPDVRGLSIRFLVFLIQTSIFYDQVLADTTGTAQFNVSTNNVGKVMFSLPTILEQTEICDWLENELSKPNELVARTEREIALMREYRTRLTADIVTGKLDVREAAANLGKQDFSPIPDDTEATDAEALDDAVITDETATKEI